MSDASARERLERLEQAVVKGLELLERGAVEEARDQLALALGERAFAARSISDRELEQAFDGAQPEIERMLDADAVAQAAIRQADQALERERRAGESLAPRFATATMAELLERQGDADGAARIRRNLAARPPAAPEPAAAPAGRPSRAAVIATLERWLGNLRGGARA